MRMTPGHASVSFVVVSALFFTLARVGRADWVDTFSGGTTDQFWQFGSDGGNPSTFTGGQVINDQLVLTANATPASGGIETAFGVVITEIFDDLKMTGVINPSGDENINDTVGLLLRGNTVNQSFYMLEVNYSEGNLIIYRNNPVVSGGNSNLATATIPNLNFTDSLYVEIEAIGSHLEVWAYEDSTRANLRATTSFNDTSEAALSSGLSGVLVNENFGGLPVLGVWDDVTATAISTGVPGDFDGDDDVDGADLVGIQRAFGATTTDQAFADWEANYGTATGGLAIVPEPSTLVLAGGMLSLLWQLRRRD